MSNKYTASDSHSSGTRPSEGSSGESSLASRLDTRDRYRIGGPGALPRWPVISSAPINLDENLANTAVEIALSQLQTSNINYDRVSFASRYTHGQTATEIDSTLLILTNFEHHRDQLVSLLDTLVATLSELGHSGRVEILDTRASGGMKSFAPKLTQEQRGAWQGTLAFIIRTLGSIEVDWRQIYATNRGYWEAISTPTVVIKTAVLIDSYPETRHIRNELTEKGLSLELMGIEGLWGLFGNLQAAIDDEQVRTSLEWPFSPSYHGMGISIGRSFQQTPRTASTLGGYLRIQKNGIEHTVGLGCYHGFRMNEDGTHDSNLDSGGATNLDWPCQSPAPYDVQIFRESLMSTAHHPIPETLAPGIKAKREAQRNQSMRQIQEINVFDPSIGNLVAVSGWHKRSLSRSISAPLVLIDWACIEILQQHCPYPINSIDDMRPRLLRFCPEAVGSWKTDKQTVDKIAQMPSQDTPIFKQGRTTGLTAGLLGGLLPAAFRLEDAPQHLHHRGYVVFTAPFRNAFSGPGDSGAWCLDGNGDVVGQLIGGNQIEGSGILIPFAVVVNDIEKKLDLKPGSIRLL
ncbi:uncharacterized protein DSM5745_10517 [Aspergillus mulundensis]|uniref:Uncharacterized protein n=1 Tax=Aspergillus mulundensis TaxID=1810919 RepID=A0A3D8QJ61_9EURO|nr:hypothetical protein DSM5745_10517 [Aspergillus mulundensis]RDW61845.1 hypothetical protein DSM5745_10517 [Aspergillus mulundensis]